MPAKALIPAVIIFALCAWARAQSAANAPAGRLVFEETFDKGLDNWTPEGPHTVEVNGQEFMDWTDPDPTSWSGGRFGFRQVYDSEGYYDNVKFYDLTAASTSPSGLVITHIFVNCGCKNKAITSLLLTKRHCGSEHLVKCGNKSRQKMCANSRGPH